MPITMLGFKQDRASGRHRNLERAAMAPACRPPRWMVQAFGVSLLMLLVACGPDTLLEREEAACDNYWISVQRLRCGHFDRAACVLERNHRSDEEIEASIAQHDCSAASARCDRLGFLVLDEACQSVAFAAD